MEHESCVRAFQNGWWWAEKEAEPVQIAALRRYWDSFDSTNDYTKRYELFEDGVLIHPEKSKYYQSQMTPEEVAHFIDGALAYLDHLDNEKGEAA